MSDDIMMSVPQQAAAALDLLRERDWTQHTARDSHGRFCLGQALGESNVLHGWVHVIQPVCDMIREMYPEAWVDGCCRRGSIIMFNDDSNTTFPMIEALLEKLAAQEG